MGCSSSFDQGTVPTHNRPIVLDRAQWAYRLAFVKVNREHTAETKNFDETIPPDDLEKSIFGFVAVPLHGTSLLATAIRLTTIRRALSVAS